MTTANDELSILIDSARNFCAKAAPLNRLRALRGTTHGYAPDLWIQMCEMGWAGMGIPERCGGSELGLNAFGAVITELGRVAATEPLLEVGAISAGLLSRLPPTATVDELLGDIASGARMPIVAWQEDPVEPSNSPAPLRATRNGDGYQLDGAKYCVPLAAVADGFLVTASLDASLAVFWIARAANGISIATHRLTDGTQHATITLTAVTVPEANCLATDCANALAATLDDGAVLSAAYLLGLSAACFETTLKYLNTRQQFGRAIGSFQALQHRAVDQALQRELAAAVVSEALVGMPNCEEPIERALLASRAKYRAARAAILITREAVQMHGAIGFTDECDIGLFLNRALNVVAAFGNAGWHGRRIAELSSGRTVKRTTSAALASTEFTEVDFNQLSDDEFRQHVRNYFEREYPSELRNPPRRLRWHEIKPWYLKLSAKGWVAPAWPREYGGMGLDPSKLLVFIEEQERWGVARAPDMGIIMVGPLLIRHGSDLQRKDYLPKILAGDYIWCQGYSEPNAGSDLASLRTAATADGDSFVLNGQKTWTTLAQDATHMFVLARTDSSAKKQAGISFLLIEMTTPGITVRPIRNIAGDEEFCEVFLDNVRVPQDRVVGTLNQGWTIAKALLGFERIFLGSPKQCQYALQRLTEAARKFDLFKDSAFRERYTHLKCDVSDLETIYGRFAAQVKRGEPLGSDVSFLKIWGTETFAKITELLLEILGSAGAQVGPISAASEVDALALFYNARPATIYGGSNEIQRNIIAKGVLGLPA